MAMSEEKSFSTEPDSSFQNPKETVLYPKGVIYLLTSLTLSWTAFTQIFTKEQQYVSNEEFYTPKWIIIIAIMFGCFNLIMTTIFIIITDIYLKPSKLTVFLYPIYLLACVFLIMSAGEFNIGARTVLDLMGIFLLLNFQFLLATSLSSIAQFFSTATATQRENCFSILYCSYHIATFILIVFRPVWFLVCEAENSPFCFQIHYSFLACLVLFSLIIHAIGTRSYIYLQPKPRILMTSLHCIYWAIRCKFTKHFLLKPTHWLGYASEKYSVMLTENIKLLLKLMQLMCTMPLFWVGIQLKNSSWIRTIPYTDQEIDGNIVDQDHLLCLTSLVVIVGTFLKVYVVYPLVPESKFMTNPLRRIGLAGVLLLIGDILHAYITYEVVKKFPSPPGYNKTNLLVINALPCTMDVKFDDNAMVSVAAYSSFMYRNLDYRSEGISDYVERNWNDRNKLYKVEGLVEFKPKRLTSYALALGARGFQVNYVQKREFDVVPKEPLSAVRVLYYFVVKLKHYCQILLENRLFSYVFDVGCGSKEVKHISMGFTEYQHVQPNTYTACWQIRNSTSKKCNSGTTIGTVNIGRSGIYNILIAQHPLTKSTYNLSAHNSSSPSNISIKYQIAEFVLVGVAELLFISASIEFFYFQTPNLFRDIVLMWYCSVIGISFYWNGFVRIFETAMQPRIGFFAFLFYPIAMIVNLLIYFKMSYDYKYF